MEKKVAFRCVLLPSNTAMPRNVINRSISFDPQVFEKMEARRGALLMDRSEYVKRCVLRDMMNGGDMMLSEMPAAFTDGAVAHQSRSHPHETPAKAGKSKRKAK
jgi:hypothetical protein